MQHLYRWIAVDACHAPVIANVRDWAWYVMHGVRDLGYDSVISATDLIHLNIGRVTQLLQARSDVLWLELKYCPRSFS